MKSLDRAAHTMVSRRTAVGGASAMGLGFLPLLGGATAAGSLPSVAGLHVTVTPEENLTNLVRITASLDPEDTPWFFNGSIYAVVGDAAPLELMRLQGMEMYRMQRKGPGSYMMKGATVTFMTDIQTGDWLRELKNPFTGRMVSVPAAAQTSGANRGYLYETTGVRPSWVVDQIPDAALKLWWTTAGEFVWLHNETVYPPGLKQPRKQRQTSFVRKDHFADQSRRRLSAGFSVTFFAPWSNWLEMGDRPGHLIWHASGAKLDSVKDLPDAYRTRIEKEYPEMMTIKFDGDPQSKG